MLASPIKKKKKIVGFLGVGGGGVVWFEWTAYRASITKCDIFFLVRKFKKSMSMLSKRYEKKKSK